MDEKIKNKRNEWMSHEHVYTAITHVTRYFTLYSIRETQNKILMKSLYMHFKITKFKIWTVSNLTCIKNHFVFPIHMYYYLFLTLTVSAGISVYC